MISSTDCIVTPSLPRAAWPNFGHCFRSFVTYTAAVDKP